MFSYKITCISFIPIINIKPLMTNQSPLFQKRKESDTDSEASQSARRKRSKPCPPGSFPSGRFTPMKLGRGEPIRREGPKWNPARIGKNTFFIMGARYVVITLHKSFMKRAGEK